MRTDPHLKLGLNGSAIKYSTDQNFNYFSPARLHSELSLSKKHIEAGLRLQMGNVAAVSGTGYSYNWGTIRAAWKW